MRKREIWIYVAVWALVFTVSMLLSGFRGVPSEASGFNWRAVMEVWRQILPVFTLFVLHDITAQYCIKHKQPVIYAIIALILVGGYAYYCIAMSRTPELGIGPVPGAGSGPGTGPGPEHVMGPGPGQHPGPPPSMPGPPPEGFRPIHPEWLKFILGLLLIGVNLGFKAFLNMYEGQRRYQQLKSENISIQQALLQSAEKTSPEGKTVLNFKAGRRTIPVSAEKIRYVEGMSEYIKLHLDGEESPLVALYNMKRLMEELPAGKFMRIHRSYIVSMSRIREAGTSTVTLDNGEVLPVSSTYKAALRDYLASGK